jgi:hypothetical protein
MTDDPPTASSSFLDTWRTPWVRDDYPFTEQETREAWETEKTDYQPVISALGEAGWPSFMADGRSYLCGVIVEHPTIPEITVFIGRPFDVATELSDGVKEWEVTFQNDDPALDWSVHRHPDRDVIIRCAIQALKQTSAPAIMAYRDEVAVNTDHSTIGPV